MRSKLKNKKLSLNIGTIRTLTTEDLSQVQGGFTYSLSTGDRCQRSNAYNDINSCKCHDAN